MERGVRFVLLVTGSIKKRRQNVFSTWILNCGRITKKMSPASFGVQKKYCSWSVLVDNYMDRKSDDKLDSLEKSLGCLRL